MFPVTSNLGTVLREYSTLELRLMMLTNAFTDELLTPPECEQNFCHSLTGERLVSFDVIKASYETFNNVLLQDVAFGLHYDMEQSYAL
jgi:hypothetical protein